MKIIPAIDLMNGEVVRLFKGDPKQKTVYSDNPVEIAKKWEDAGADMLHLVDLDATLGLGENSEIIKKICENISIPVQVAGGLRDIKKISAGGHSYVAVDSLGPGLGHHPQRPTLAEDLLDLQERAVLVLGRLYFLHLHVKKI